ncbi:hypothetical protein RHMOL_Rhmol02G0246200 [Rhododendron molle]|uniref:Uncharacterized protein n=1 Tax=Rhododendron molle TaxID=49168 RepID=A0ACC0PWU8_RHOML|nr:hypothetical protein RHMOL_Rhmol02G0246200 [Rhododendron molle]
MGAPLRVMLKHLSSRTVAPDMDGLVALVHRPTESFFLVPQAEKVTVVFPMRFKDSIDTILATSFLQEFVEARRTAGLVNAPPCSWSPYPPLELKGAAVEALFANAGFVSFVLFPRHVEGIKLDKTVWNLSTFHAYVNYHVKSAAALFGVAGVLARKTTVCFTVKVVNAFKVLALGHTDVLFDPNLWCKIPNSAQKDSCALE